MSLSVMLGNLVLRLLVVGCVLFPSIHAQADAGQASGTGKYKELIKTATIKLRGKESSAKRRSLAKVSEAQAEQEALRHVHGHVKRTDLDNEYGYLVYSVDVLRGSTSFDVKIDAGTGKFLYIDTDPDGKEEEVGN